MILRTRLAF